MLYFTGTAITRPGFSLINTDLVNIFHAFIAGEQRVRNVRVLHLAKFT